MCVVVTAMVMLSVPVCPCDTLQTVEWSGTCNDVVSACLLLYRRLESDDVVVRLCVISCVSQ